MVSGYDLHELAEVELEEAVDWYEQQKQGLGATFFKEYIRVKDLILQHPQLFPIELDEIRKAPLRNFPYSLYYLVLDDFVFIISVFHHKREPESWKGRN